MKTSGLSRALRRARIFLSHDIWEVDLADIGWIKRPLIKCLRVVTLSVRGFVQDELPLRASGLTYVTLLSVAPLLAFVFTIFRGMGKGEEAIAKVREAIVAMPEQIQQFVETIIKYIESANAAGIGGVAVLILLYAVIKVMGNIELTFNKVWGVTNSRTILRKFTDYISILVLFPMFIIAASALSSLRNSVKWQEQLQDVYALTDRLLVFAPFLSAAIAFALLYLFMPNTRVKLKPAVVSGAVAAFMWVVWMRLYLTFQGVLLGGTDKIFGAFASVPITMFYLYVCWVIILFGVEVAFAMQNYATYARERNAYAASDESRLLVAIAVMQEASRAMQGDNGPFRADTFGHARGVPIRLLNDVIQVLRKGGLLGGLDDQPHAYVLVRAPEQIRVQQVIDLVLREGTQPSELGLGHLDPRVHETWDTARAGMRHALADGTFAGATSQAVEPEHTVDAAPEPGETTG
jgi:membrane protein